MDTTAMCENNVYGKKMDDEDKKDDSLAVELYTNTMTGQWKKVVEMYKEHHIKAISAKINTSGDTALHVAVSIAPDKEAQQLVSVIKDWYDEEVKKVEKGSTDILKSAVWIKNNEGNTPLHVAASTGRLNICIRLVSIDYIQSLGIHNNLGESPLFVAAFHGRQEIFLLLHLLPLLGCSNIHSESLDPAYTREDGETILHCAIRWEYFDLAFEILNLESRLAYSKNDEGITPLHLLASKPWAFSSGFQLGWWKKIIYYCIYVEELKSQTALQKLIDFTKENNQNFQKSYQACICFYRMLKAKAQNVIETIKDHCKGRNEDVENPSKLNTTGQSENKGQNTDEENPSESNVIGQSEIEGQNVDIENPGESNVTGQSEIEGQNADVENLSKSNVTGKSEIEGQNADEEYPSESNVTGQLEIEGQNADIENPSKSNGTGQSKIEGQNADVENPSKSNVIGQSEIEGSQHRSKTQQLQFFIRRYAINIFCLFYKILSSVIPRLGYEELKKTKEKHVHSVQIMKLLIKHAKDAKFDFSSGVGPKQIMNQQETRKGPPSSSSHLTTDRDTATGSQTGQQNGNKRNKTDFEEKKNGRGKEETSKLVNTETPVLLAARNGITEMVEQILAAFPLAITDQSEGKNIVHWAVKNRQPRVLQILLKHNFVKRKLIHEVDTKENNALHLAAKIGKKKPWLIPGAALQMQWEIKWYKFVKDNMPQHFCYQLNKVSKTPEEIFNETHEELVKHGGEWLNKTSESCSLVAALIATVAFAASTTIPGNINEKSGEPNLENQPELTVFAISSLVALCFSITSLFSFLAILTSRHEHKDFRTDLPKKLLLGLTSLFVSITSMLVSFCAGHFFMLKNKLKDKAFPVYAATCLPMVFFAIQQLPLYLDIIWAIIKKVPRSSYKAVSL